jgi:hypothetical protein
VRSVGHGFAKDGVTVGTALLDVTGGLVGALDEAELVLAVVLLKGVSVELGSSPEDDVQPASSRAADTARAAIAATGTFIRVATPPSRGEEPRQLAT